MSLGIWRTGGGATGERRRCGSAGLACRAAAIAPAQPLHPARQHAQVEQQRHRAQHAPALDGVDLLPYLTGKKSGDPHETLFWRIAERDIWAIRSGDHKLVKQGETVSLHDLSTDTREGKDLAGKLPEVRAGLQKVFAGWQETLRDPLWKTYRTPEIEPAEEQRRMRNRAKQ